MTGSVDKRRHALTETGSGSMHYPCSGPRDIRFESVKLVMWTDLPIMLELICQDVTNELIALCIYFVT